MYLCIKIWSLYPYLKYLQQESYRTFSIILISERKHVTSSEKTSFAWAVGIVLRYWIIIWYVRAYVTCKRFSAEIANLVSTGKTMKMWVARLIELRL